jgi:protein-S-isoprenylcysteine O-methyltransferase Ste14
VTPALLAHAVVGGGGVWKAARADRGSYWWIQAAQIGAELLGLLARWAAPWANLPGWVWRLGIVTMVAGMAVRVWALRVLGEQFRRDVVVTPDQPVVTGGPYRWVRHPSYTGPTPARCSSSTASAWPWPTR